MMKQDDHPIKIKLAQFAATHGWECEWMLEDSLTFLEIRGDTIRPKDSEKIAQDVANCIGHDVHFNRASFGEVVFVIDFNFDINLPFTHDPLDQDMRDYLSDFSEMVFKPQNPAPSSPSPPPAKNEIS